MMSFSGVARNVKMVVPCTDNAISKTLLLLVPVRGVVVIVVLVMVIKSR